MSDLDVSKRKREQDVFIAALRRLSNNQDFTIVLSKINSLGGFRKNLSADDPIVLARISGKQIIPNYLNDKIDELKRNTED
jgi:hypothetical protein